MCGNYSREETIQGRKLYEEIRYFSCPLLSSKLDSPVIKTLETLTQTKKNPLSNVLITGESNLDERSGQLNRGAYILKLLVTKLVL